MQLKKAAQASAVETTVAMWVENLTFEASIPSFWYALRIPFRTAAYALAL